MFENMEYIHLLWLLLGVIIFIIFVIRRKKSLIVKLTSENNFQHLAKNFSINRQIVKWIVKLVGILLLILTLMRPLGSPKEEFVKVKGRDIIFMLDVSKSMLAEDGDFKTSRLERVKIAIKDVINILTGDRVALVVFAGATGLKCPLTYDYGFFKTILTNVSPLDINRGGSLIGDAIRFVDRNILSTYSEEYIRYQDIILITDGEDQESFPLEAAKAIAEKRVKIHTVGIGSLEGTKIPIKDKDGNITGFIKQNSDTDEAHRSVLQEDTLKEIARITGGIYVPARTNAFFLDELYLQRIASEEQKESDITSALRYQEWYQLFLIPCIILLLLSFFIPNKKRINNHLRG